MLVFMRGMLPRDVAALAAADTLLLLMKVAIF